MFVDELSTKDSLARMVRRMTANFALREDLLQEALIHLWLTEARRPGQTKSWYLQSCKYHLLHYLASGRSVDSGKRRGGQLQSTLELNDRDIFPDEIDSGNSVLAWVSARDIISLLSPQLLPHEKAVLHCFADGLGPREIGRKLKMSHTMVIKHRRKIALLFTRLDLPALPRANIARLNGNQNGKGNGELNVERRSVGASERRSVRAENTVPLLGTRPVLGQSRTNGYRTESHRGKAESEKAEGGTKTPLLATRPAMGQIRTNG